jgi:NADH-quinone oxidoreductase subunit E
MVLSSFHVPATYKIDLETVRQLLHDHYQPENQQEGFELILGALLEIQEHFGWVSRAAAHEVAQHLHVPFARVFEVLTFYGDFKLKPPGQHRLQLCCGTACFAMGAAAVQRTIEAKLGIAAGETTANGQVTFDLIPTCLGVCDRGPLGLFDGHYYPLLTPEQVGAIVDQVIHQPRPGGAH